MNIENILAAIDAEISRLQQVRKLLSHTGTQSAATKPATKKRRRKMSAEARKKIAGAQGHGGQSRSPNSYRIDLQHDISRENAT